MVACSLPVVSQLVLMCPCPLNYEASRSRWQLAGDDCQALDVDGGLCVPITGMKVRPPSMVILVVVHPDRDPIEAADSRHPARLGPPPLRNKTAEWRISKLSVTSQCRPASSIGWLVQWSGSAGPARGHSPAQPPRPRASISSGLALAFRGSSRSPGNLLD